MLAIGKLRRAVESRHETKAKIAKRAGMSPQQLANILHGRVPNPTLDTVDALADALGLDPRDLIVPRRKKKSFGGNNVNSLFEGDALDVLPELPDKSVNLICTSPPYGDARARHYGGVHPDEYVEWFAPISQSLLRVLRDDGSFVINIKEKVVKGERHTYVHDLIAMMRSQGWRWVEEYVWRKTCSAPGKWSTRFRDGWERCLHFTRSKKFAMYQNAVMVPAADATRARAKYSSQRDGQRQLHATGSGFASRRDAWRGRDLVFPDNVIECAPERTNVGHPAPYPRAIPEFFIKLFTREGDTVLDPFVGSGTTALVACELGRRYAGIERMPSYVELANRRLAEECPPCRRAG